MKTLKTNLTICLLLLASICFAQTPDWIWVKQGSGNSTNEGKAVVADPSGNLYVAGSYGQTATFGTLSVTGGDMFIAKYDQNGNPIWINSAKGSIKYATYDIDIDSDNNLYVLGSMNSTATFGGISLTTNGSNDVFIAKYNNSGELIWAKNYGGPNYDDVKKLSVDGSNNITIIGGFYDNTNFGNNTVYARGTMDICIAKLDSSGTLIWLQSFGGKGIDAGAGIVCDKDDNIYATGSFADSCLIGNNTLVAQGQSDVFTAKFDANGNCIWAKQSVGVYANYPRDICTDGKTNIYVTGAFGQTATFGSHSLTGAGSVPNTDVFIVKYDSSGDCKMAVKAGGASHEQSYGIYANNLGEVFVGGVFHQNTTFGSHSLSGNNSDIFLAKCNASGTFEWAIGAGAASFDECWDITFANDKLIAVGAFTFTVKFGPHTLSASGTSLDMYIASIGIPPPPSISITEHPKSFNTCTGDSVTFEITAVGSEMSYQWNKNGDAISGATKSILTINGVSSSDAGSYTCTISDSAYSVTSEPGILNLGGEPVISQQPVNKTVNKGQNVTIKIVATGATSYQWQKDGIDLSGETTNTLIISSVQKTDEGVYRCVVSGPCGSVVSNEGTLSVSTSGLNDQALNDLISVSPNPSYGVINITSESLSGSEVNICIYNMNGKTVYSQWISGSEDIKIDLSDLEKGMYIVMAKNSNQSYVSKILLR
ncbi:immunoglobulin domain-containing protein [Bacteroidota bacterium]